MGISQQVWNALRTHTQIRTNDNANSMVGQRITCSSSSSCSTHIHTHAPTKRSKRLVQCNERAGSLPREREREGENCSRRQG